MISVIIPNYNHQDYLAERLDSVLNQSYDHIEVIILDDASTDGSLEVINSYRQDGRIKAVEVNDTNSGSPFHQWSKGISRASGDWIWIAESDDYAANHFLQSIVKKMKDGTGLYYAQSADVNEKGDSISSRLNYTAEFQPNIWQESFEMQGKDFINNYLSLKNVIPNASAVVFKKDLATDILKESGWQQMRMLGDWYFWLRLADQTSVVFISETLNYFRIHANVTRIHDSPELKKNRLKEEKMLRDLMDDKGLAKRSDHWQSLDSKWFKTLKFTKLFKNELFEIRPRRRSKLTHLIRFISYKLKSKFA